MFGTLSRSWQFAKVSYGMLWDNKRMILFPLLSTIAAIVVSASFILPLWHGGQLDAWFGAHQQGGRQAWTVGTYCTIFLFYLANYFVILFFNTGLSACAMKAAAGREPSVGFGLGAAAMRWHQILGWAIVSATVGVILRVIENAHERAGQFIAAILGTAWTAMTYFVVPVIVLEGVGPIEAFKRSLATLKKTWGTALVGNFSLGFLGFLITLPFLLIAGLLFYAAASQGAVVGMAAAGALFVLVVVLSGAVNAAADMIFKTLLFQYATGKSLPDSIDTDAFADAFTERQR